MRVVLRKRGDNKYYVREGIWSENRDEAAFFKSSIEALQRCTEQNIQDVEIVLSFREARFDVEIPVKKN